jgi:hypothetical protein
MGVKVRAVGFSRRWRVAEDYESSRHNKVDRRVTDVAVVHQRGAAIMVKESLLMPVATTSRRASWCARQREERAGRERRGLCAADVPQPDRLAYNPDLVRIRRSRTRNWPNG